MAVRVRPVGAHALLLEVDDPAGWFTELWRRREAGELVVADIVPGARTVLLDGLADLTGAAGAVRHWAPVRREVPGPQRWVEVPVAFDGADLGAVAQLWRTDERGVVDRLVATQLRVAFCGFSPGWAYLTGLPQELAVPRLATPRPKVPAGSVALADRYAGIYPTSSPGGWLLVGRTEISLFDPDRSPPALLTPDTGVRLVERGRP